MSGERLEAFEPGWTANVAAILVLLILLAAVILILKLFPRDE
jgi:hypothetical protein